MGEPEKYIQINASYGVDQVLRGKTESMEKNKKTNAANCADF